MHKVVFIVVALFAATANLYAQKQTSLSGKITDQSTGVPLSGVSVYFPDLQAGSITDNSGQYHIEDLPKMELMVEISTIGFKLLAETIDLSNITTKDFAMIVATTELNEVVVTGLSKSAQRNRTSSPIMVITPTQLKQMTSVNIIDALATQPGISQITTGAGISKPVIRGLGYNRVLIVNDGIRQEGQQWGDEHGLEIDEYGVNRVEILKGPASLAYGSDALAGVVNFLPAPILPEGTIRGSLFTNYQTNNGLYGVSLNLGGNQNGIVWDARYSNKAAHAYTNKYDGYVFNSGFKENNFGGMIGMNRYWGYSHLNFSTYNLTPGIVEGERDPIIGQFVKTIAINNATEDEVIATKSDFKSYRSFVPYQKIHHYKLVSTNNFIFGNGALKTIIGWQQNRRQEFEEVLQPEEYGLYFYMNTINYDARYSFTTRNDINVSFGANGMFQNSLNKGVEFLIPDYNLFDIGAFVLAKKSWYKWTLSGGLRYDLRTQHGKDIWLNENDEKTNAPDANSEQLFTAFNTKYKGISGSIGTTYQFNDMLYTKLNISKGFRAPNIAEISANGVHEGSVQYIIGSATLKPENSFQIDYALGFNSDQITAEANLFYNSVSNYIFLEKLNGIAGSDSLTNGYQTFNYTSGDARLYGGEITIDIHPYSLDWLHFENSFSYVRSVQINQPDSMRNLPLTPSPKLHTELRATASKLGGNLKNAYVKIGVDNYFKQNYFYEAFGTETATPGYTLLNAGIGADVFSKKRSLFSIYISANNLTNVAYQSHLSRLKYLDENNANGRKGVFNMGRNFSFKLIVPI